MFRTTVITGAGYWEASTVCSKNSWKCKYTSNSRRRSSNSHISGVAVGETNAEGATPAAGEVAGTVPPWEEKQQQQQHGGTEPEPSLQDPQGAVKDVMFDSLELTMWYIIFQIPFSCTGQLIWSYPEGIIRISKDFLKYYSSSFLIYSKGILRVFWVIVWFFSYYLRL